MKNKRCIFIGIFFIYFIFAVRIIIFKDIPISSVFNYVGRTREINIIPFRFIYDFFFSGTVTLKQVLVNIVGNVAIFIPLGIIIPNLFNKKSFLNITVITGLSSFSLECIQFILAVGTSDIDDILLNIIGGIMGWLFYQCIQKKSLTNEFKEKIYILVLIIIGFLSFGILLFTNSEILIHFNKTTQMENEELVQHIDDITRPDYYGQVIKCEGEEITVEVKGTVINLLLNNNTKIHREIYDSKSFLGQIIKECITFEDISQEEFMKIFNDGSINDKVSIWSEDGNYIDDLIIFEWNIN